MKNTLKEGVIKLFLLVFLFFVPGAHWPLFPHLLLNLIQSKICIFILTSCHYFLFSSCFVSQNLIMSYLWLCSLLPTSKPCVMALGWTNLLSSQTAGDDEIVPLLGAHSNLWRCNWTLHIIPVSGCHFVRQSLTLRVITSSVSLISTQGPGSFSLISQGTPICLRCLKRLALPPESDLG